MANWRYENYGTAALLSSTGTTLTDLPVTQSKTSYAFYQTTRAKCFDIPATKEIWLKFDVYTTLNTRWRAYNEGTAGICGVCSQTTGQFDFWANGTQRKYFTSKVKNQLQTVLLHMISGSSAGVIEAWLDGVKLYTYTGNVNNGADFADIYLQSDGAGTFFSNVIISNVEVGLNEKVAPVGFKYTWSFDTERIVNNTIRGAKETVVYLHFDDANDPFFDACGNKWNAIDYEGVPVTDEYELENSLTTGKFGSGGDFYPASYYLKIDEPIKLGGKDFTIDFWHEHRYSEDSGLGLFEILSADTNTPLISLYFSGYDWREGGEDSEPTLTLKVRNVNGDTAEHQIFIPFGGWHHYAYVYDTRELKAVLYLDGVAVVTLALADAEMDETDCTITIGKIADGYYMLNGSIDEFRIVDGLALWDSDFTPPTQQINFFKVDTDFDAQRDIYQTLSLNFDVERKIIGSDADSWYYENFGNASLLAPEATNVEGVTVPDLSSDVSKTGSAYWVPAGVLRNMFGLQPTKEIWAKFDGYLSDVGIIYAYDIQQFASSYRYYGFRLISVATADNELPIAVLLTGSSTDTDRATNQTLIGLHSFLVHLLSDEENGKIELWIDDETTPVLTFTGNVNNGNNFSNFLVTGSDANALVSNLIISGSKLSITDNVQFIGYSYVKNIEVERVLTNDGFPARVINATRVLLTFDKDSAPFEDSAGNHWTAHCNPTISADNAKFGKALQLDEYSYLQMDNKIVLGGQDFTIDGWFCVPSEGVSGNDAYICYLLDDEYIVGHGVLHNGIFFSTNYADQANFSIALPDSTNAVSTRSYAAQTVFGITRNEWHHFAICFNHTTQKITFALDGKVYAHDVHSVDEAMSYTVLVGGYAKWHNAEFSFRGTIDEFRIIKGIALYTHDFTPPTRSAWAKIIDENFDVIRQIPHELIVMPTEDFIPVAKNETDGTQSVEIAISEQQLTDQLTYVTVNNVDIEQQVTGQYLDYLFDMRVEESNSYGILTTAKCCSNVDEILYSMLDYSIEADFTFVQVNLKSKTIHISSYPYIPTPEEENEVTEIEKATALQHVNKIAAALGKTAVTYFDNFVSDLDIEQKNITYADLINNLFGWTARLPHMLINCYIRNDTLYVVQRGHEPNTINLTSEKHTVPRISKKIVCTTWAGSPDSSYTLNKHYLGWRVYYPPPDKSEDGKTTYTYKRIEPHGYLLTKSETTEKEIVNGSEKDVITEVSYEYTVLKPYELKTETTKKYVKDSGRILEQSEIVHEQLTPSQRITRRFGEDGEQTGSVVGSHVAGFYDDYVTTEPEHTEAEEITIPGNPLIDTNFPVYGNDTLAKLSREIRWLNRKIQETVSFDLYDYPHVVDFLDKIIFCGNEYFLQRNVVSKTPRIVNKQSLTLVRWY